MPASSCPPNDIRVEHDDAASALLCARGEFDLANAHLLTHALERQLRRGPRDIRLDVSEVSFIDVVGIETILASAQQIQAGGGAFQLIRPSRAVSRLLRLAGLEQALTEVGSLAI